MAIDVLFFLVIGGIIFFLFDADDVLRVKLIKFCVFLASALAGVLLGIFYLAFNMFR